MKRKILIRITIILNRIMIMFKKGDYSEEKGIGKLIKKIDNYLK